MNRPLCNKCKTNFCEIANRNKDNSVSYRKLCWKCRSYNPNPENYLKRKRDWYKNIKKEVLNHYGNKCECCNESIIEFLTVDHINNDGANHRKQKGGNCKRLFRWLKQHNYPEGFRILCFNCNCGRQLNNGICPHNK